MGASATFFDAALERTWTIGAPFWITMCAHPGLRDELASLLAAHDGAADFIELPAHVVAADLFVEDSGPSSPAGVGPYLVRQRSVRRYGDRPRGRHTAVPPRGAEAILPELQSDGARRERLRQEARAAASSHPGIATVYAIEEIDGGCTAAEYVAGPTLRALLEPGPLPTVLLLDLATQLARALAAAHAQGVVHRDLKPRTWFEPRQASPRCSISACPSRATPVRV